MQQIFHQQGNSFKGKSLAMGSPFWMAPEAVKEKPQTPQVRNDHGCVVYFCCFCNHSLTHSLTNPLTH